MGRSRQVATAATAVLASVGCTATQKLHTAFAHVQNHVSNSVGFTEPATQVVCVWEPKPATLTDPTHDGGQTLGLVGQVFLFGPAGTAVPAAGEISFVVYDETPYPPGSAARAVEQWHLDAATFARLKTSDHRFGECYAMFLPWPTDWGTAVTKVRIAARYQAPGIDLTAIDVKLNIDHTGQSGVAVDGVTPTRASSEMRGVPDPARMIRDLQNGGIRVPPQVQHPAPTLTQPTVTPPTVTPPSVPLPAPRVAPEAPMFQPASAESLVPKNTVNTPFQTEGAWAGPKPPNPLKAEPIPGPVAPLIPPGPGI